ncbi:MAG: phosphatidylinositol mannoside acyltransferase [Pseudonocardia sp.]
MSGRAVDLGYALAWRLVRALPEPVAAGGFRAGADLAVRRDGPGVRQLRANLARVLGQPVASPGGPGDAGPADPGAPGRAELEELVAAAMRSYARYWREAFRLPTMDPVALHAWIDPEVAGVEHLDRALDAGRGVVAALTHSGNWDVAGVWLVEALRRRGRPATFATVAERLRPESLYDRFVDYRAGLGFEVLPADAGARTVATLAARLRAGGVVCLVADRDITGAGTPVEFFGAPASMPAGPAQLALRTGAALLPFGGWFTPDGWGLRFHPPIEMTAASGPGAAVAAAAGTTTAGVTAAAATQALADVFAREIAAHPADWHMLQPIWTADRLVAGVAR